ncbi:BTB/POZ domain-containing protein 9-like isoform X2 [Contarinia nasturtii]|uniref:BTB/POZ domain-containing protein 9-like isoform X2 n=1 Tax=Contarinia nasturtii TaxID=265458 RepID=UPI0012D3C13C|nr:BTB/POZ domain-containing protein 9-like isoform X2 [Contarinia nasturtii]
MAANDVQFSELDFSDEKEEMMKKPFDVTLIVQNTRIQAHKSFLASRSEYFQIKDIVDVYELTGFHNFPSLERALSKYLTSIDHCCSTLIIAKLHSLDKLETECLKSMDCHSFELLQHDTFTTLPYDCLSTLLKRDTFYASEINIFKAVQNWLANNPTENVKKALSLVRWLLISSDEVENTVLPTNILDRNPFLKFIEFIKNTSVVAPRTYSEETFDIEYFDLNVATTEQGASIICGEGDALLIQDFPHPPHELNYTYHYIGGTELSSSIIVDLGRPNTINFIRILLLDENYCSYSYFVESSLDGVEYERLIDYTKNYCRSWQSLYFPPQQVRYIKLVGTGTLSESHETFDVARLQAMFRSKPNVEMVNGVFKPHFNVAKCSFDLGVIVIEGILGHAMFIDDEKTFTSQDVDTLCLMLQFNQPYYIGSLRMLLGNDHIRMTEKFSFYITTSLDKQHWTMAVDKRTELLSGWQEFEFKPRKTTFIRLKLKKNEHYLTQKFVLTYFECPSDPKKPSIMSKTSKGTATGCSTSKGTD